MYMCNFNENDKFKGLNLRVEFYEINKVFSTFWDLSNGTSLVEKLKEMSELWDETFMQCQLVYGWMDTFFQLV